MNKSYKAIIFDFSKVFLFPKEPEYTGSLNAKNKELIEKYGSAYPFLEYFRLNEELLELATKLSKTFQMYVFTTDDIQDNPQVKPTLDKIFDRIFKARELGIAKTDSKAYETIAKTLGMSVEEIIYIDDTLENVEAAKQTGLYAIHYKNNEQLISELS
jgi:FMN phosphatase YigB (HAD superfamily)